MFANPILYYCSKVVLHKIRVHIESHLKVIESGGYAFHSLKKFRKYFLANTIPEQYLLVRKLYNFMAKFQGMYVVVFP